MTGKTKPALGLWFLVFFVGGLVLVRGLEGQVHGFEPIVAALHILVGMVIMVVSIIKMPIPIDPKLYLGMAFAGVFFVLVGVGLMVGDPYAWAVIINALGIGLSGVGFTLMLLAQLFIQKSDKKPQG